MATARAARSLSTDEPRTTSALRSRTVLFVEASSGGVVGGSLTGLLHQMRGMGPGWRSVLALYEEKAIEAEVEELGVRVYHVPRWRVPKEHALQQATPYHAMRRIGAVRDGLHLGRVLLRTLVEEFPAALALARVIRAEHADVVHLGNGVRANFDGILACWLTRRPCIAHGKGFEKLESRERLAAPYIDAVVCMTEAVKRHFEQAGVKARRMPVIYDAIDTEGFRPQRGREAVRAELDLTPGDCAVGIIGGIQEWKGQAVVVEAIARARAQRPDLRLLVIGGVHRAGTRYADDLRARIRDLGIEDSVRFLGQRTDVADLVNALDIVVHASIKPEPFGRVILEAMLLGRPVIAAAAGGVPEFVDDGRTGLLVAPGDVDGLAAALLDLANNPEKRTQLGRAAQIEARQRFGLAQHVERMTALYESLLKDK